jgi:hypothetical protein
MGYVVSVFGAGGVVKEPISESFNGTT